MGTRADFYIGSGAKAEWIGSVAWDGYEWAEDDDCSLLKAKTVDEFKAAVIEISTEREDFTAPEMGWPWPWNDSSITDYAYYFEDGETKYDDRSDWPDMSELKNVASGERSGLMVFSVNQ